MTVTDLLEQSHVLRAASREIKALGRNAQHAWVMRKALRARGVKLPPMRPRR